MSEAKSSYIVFDPQRMQFVNPTRLKKMALAKQVASYLRQDEGTGDRQAIESVAMVLAEDVAADVRSTLAFELRLCPELPEALTDIIARDIEDIAAPFLMETPAMSGTQLAALIPELEEYARIAIAKRRTLPTEAQMALVEFGGEEAVTYLVRNDVQQISQDGLTKLVHRFSANRRLMDQLSGRTDLPLIVVQQIVDKVSEHCREALVRTYKVDNKAAKRLATATRVETLVRRLSRASSQQVHAYVRDLRAEKRFNHVLALELAERGILQVMESALALEAGVTLAEVRTILSLHDKRDFVALMRRAGVSQLMAPRYLALAKIHYQSKA